MEMKMLSRNKGCSVALGPHAWKLMVNVLRVQELTLLISCHNRRHAAQRCWAALQNVHTHLLSHQFWASNQPERMQVQSLLRQLVSICSNDAHHHLERQDEFCRQKQCCVYLVTC